MFEGKDTKAQCDLEVVAEPTVPSSVPAAVRESYRLGRLSHSSGGREFKTKRWAAVCLMRACFWGADCRPPCVLTWGKSQRSAPGLLYQALIPFFRNPPSSPSPSGATS